MHMCMHVHVSVRDFRSRVYLASYLTSDSLVRRIPPVLSIGWDHALILVEVERGVKYVYVYACTCECKESWVEELPRRFPYVRR